MKNIILIAFLFIFSVPVSAGLYFNAFGHRDGSRNADNLNIECAFHGWPNDGLVQAEQNRNNENAHLLAPEVAYMSFDVNAGIPKSTGGWFNVRQETFEFTRNILDIDYNQSNQRSARLTETGGGYGEGSGRTKFRWSNWNLWEIHLSDFSYLNALGISKDTPTKNVYLYMEHVFGADKYRKWIDISAGGGADNLTDEEYSDHSGVQTLQSGGRMFGKWYAKFNRRNDTDVFSWDGGEYTCTLKGASVLPRSSENELLSKSKAIGPARYFSDMTPRIEEWQKDNTVSGTLAQYRDSDGSYVDFSERDGKFANSHTGSFGPFGMLIIGLGLFLRHSRFRFCFSR